MEKHQTRLAAKCATQGAVLGLALGLFVALSSGTFAGPSGTALVLAVPLVLAFVLIGAWFATMISLSAIDEAGSEDAAEEIAQHDAMLGSHPHVTAA